MIESSGLGGDVFNADLLKNETEFEIAYVMFVLGLNPENIDSVTIDELISSIRSSFDYKIIGEIPDLDASYRLLKQQCNSLLRHTRKSWFSLCFAKGVIANG
jgi:hypothetical protein